MSLAAFTAALRIARRDAWQHKARSLLVIALIGLPVLAIGFADIAYRTWQVTPTVRITREIGAANAAAQPSCGPVEQAPGAWLSGGSQCESAASTPGPGPVTQPAQTHPLSMLLAHLPPGTRAIARVAGVDGARIKTAAGVKYTNLTGFDYADPIARGTVRQLSGRAPRTTGEVALTQALATSIGAHVGDTLRLLSPERTVAVVGIVRAAGSRFAQTIYTLPSAVTVGTDGYAPPVTWLLHTSASLGWSDVLTLNQLGYAVLSRAVYLDPPPRSAVPFYRDNPRSHLSTQVIATVTLVVGMALLEIVLLAGPAFAVGARRQRRDLALVAATGGRSSDLRNIVLANGVVLGLAGGVLATCAAVVVAAVAFPIVAPHVDQIPGPFTLHPLELAAIALVSLLTGLLAAIVPAIHAARTDVVAALGGRRGTVRTRKRVPIVGAAIAAIGVLVAIFGVTNGHNSANTILAGAALTEVGLIICTPTVLGAASRLGRLLPLGPRIALRDAGRNRSAATPAVAAVMASMISAVALLITVQSTEDQRRRTYEPLTANHAVLVSLDQGAPGAAAASPATIAQLMRNTLPVRDVGIVRSPNENCTPTRPLTACQVTTIDLLVDGQPSYGNGRYIGSAFPPVLIDDGSSVAALFGKSEPAAVAALRAGHAVVTSPDTLRNGQVTLGINTSQVSAGPVDETQRPDRPVTLPAVAVADGFAATLVILPPGAIRELTTTTIGVVATTATPPTDRQLQIARGQLAQLSSDLYLSEETGYHDTTAWELYALIGVAAAIAIGAAAIATALANADGRDDLTTLGAIGASPRTRRVMSMSRAGVIAGIGCAVGVAAGFVPAYAWYRSHRLSIPSRQFSGGQPVRLALDFVVPWLPIMLGLVGVPLVAAALAGVFSRSRLPSERAAD